MFKKYSLKIIIDKEFSSENILIGRTEVESRSYSDMNTLTFSTLQNFSYFLVENKGKRLYASNKILKVVI
jgi:hypothetical protein